MEGFIVNKQKVFIDFFKKKNDALVVLDYKLFFFFRVMYSRENIALHVCFFFFNKSMTTQVGNIIPELKTR